LKSIGASNQTTVFGYDKDNNLSSTTDPLTNATTQAFDALNRLIQVAAPLSATTAYDYDAHNNRTGVTDPRSLVTSYVYDGLDDLIQTASPDTGTSVYVADAAGNRTQRTDAAGVVTNYTYDALSRLTAKTFPTDASENVTYTYDATNAGDGIGHLTSVTDQSGSTGLVYDALGDVTQETRVIGGVQYVTSYAYDLAGHVAQETYPSGRIVTYTRDGMGQIANVTTQQNAQALSVTVASNVGYEPFGPLAALTYGNGLALAIGYDQDYQPSTRIVSGNATVQSLAYGFDAAGDLKTANDHVDATRNQAFNYDALYHLTQASGTYGAYAYGYDADGNRSSIALTGGSNNFSATYAYAANSNQLQTVTSGSNVRSLTYTADGNTLQDNLGTGAVFGYSYNNDNRLIQSALGGVSQASYTLNYLGQRVIKAATISGTTHFHYDRAGHLIAESDGSGNLLDEYVWLDDTPLAFVTPTSIDFIHADHLGTPQRFTAPPKTAVPRMAARCSSSPRWSARVPGRKPSSTISVARIAPAARSRREV
jgi:YD repeat-containing protein